MSLLIDSVLSDKSGYLVILRHGEIDKEHRFGAIGDGRLSDTGISVVRETAMDIVEFLKTRARDKIDLVFSSSSVRCLDTYHVFTQMASACQLLVPRAIPHENFFMTEEERSRWALADAEMRDATGKRTPEYQRDIDELGRQAAVMKRVDWLVRACVNRSCYAIENAIRDAHQPLVIMLVTHGPHEAFIAQHFLRTDQPPQELVEGQARIINFEFRLKDFVIISPS